MGQSHSSKQVTGRLHCENDSCSDPITHFCSYHDQVLCASCSANFHQKCRPTKIPNEKDVADCLDFTKSVLSSIRQDSKHFKTRSSTKYFDKKLKTFKEMLLKINKKFTNSVKNKNSHEFCSIMKEVVQLQKELIESDSIAQSSLSKEFKLALSGEPIQYVRDSEQIDKRKQEEYKHVVSDTTRKEILQRERKIFKQEYKIQETVFSRIYQRHTGEKIPDIPSFHFQINLNDANQISLMKDLVNSRLRLPDLKGIKIDYISDADADLASFLSECTPAKLKLLYVNLNANSFTGIKSKFYVKAFLEAERRTTKEVYFCYIEFSSEDLQAFVRAAHNAEEIVLSFCGIHCSPGLDFGVDLSYNTKLLSFEWCGDYTLDGMTTDWIEDPSKFSLIVDAIGSSGLRTSLEKLSIAYNRTLFVPNVQEELNAKGMSHISVVHEWKEPFSF